MAVYHFSVKTVSRSSGRSATAAAAYRAAEKLADMTTGELHDYSRKSGVMHSRIFLPKDAPAWASNRQELWNAAELAETRKNSTVAREFEVALPAELDEDQRRELAEKFVAELVERHGFAADLNIHAPGREGDSRNHHAHILCTTRRLGPDGFTEKTRELDDRKSKAVDQWREEWARMQNEALERAHRPERVDHRSLKDQGIDREPTRHMGPMATGFERRTGQKSDRRVDFEREVAERLERAAELGRVNREGWEVQQGCVLLTVDVTAARNALAAIREKAKAKAHEEAQKARQDALRREDRDSDIQMAEERLGAIKRELEPIEGRQRTLFNLDKGSLSRSTIHNAERQLPVVEKATKAEAARLKADQDELSRLSVLRFIRRQELEASVLARTAALDKLREQLGELREQAKAPCREDIAAERIELIAKVSALKAEETEVFGKLSSLSREIKGERRAEEMRELIAELDRKAELERQRKASLTPEQAQEEAQAQQRSRGFGRSM